MINVGKHSILIAIRDNRTGASKIGTEDLTVYLRTGGTYFVKRTGRRMTVTRRADGGFSMRVTISKRGTPVAT